MLLSSKSLICNVYRAEKNRKKYSMWASHLATEQRLKHSLRFLTYFSITDCVGSLFFGSPDIFFLFYLENCDIGSRGELRVSN